MLVDGSGYLCPELQQRSCIVHEFLGSYVQPEAALNRVASVKAMAQASRYFNGANITQDMIIRTSEKADGSSDTEIIENIRENSVGYVKALEQLTNFTRKDGLQVFIFITPLRNNEKKH